MTISPTIEPAAYSRRNPFPAALVCRTLLSAPSEPNPKHHYEISLEGSGLHYEPGDSLAIFPENDPRVVEAILALFGWNGSEELARPDGQASILRQVLLRHVSITKPSRRLREMVEKLRGPMPALCDVIDLLSAAPELCRSLTPQEFVASLDKLQPRLYSIASSMHEHGAVAHLFVSSVFYDARLRQRLHQALAKYDGLVDNAGACLCQIVGMNMDIPESRQEIRAAQVHHFGVAPVGRMAPVEDLGNPSSLDHDAATSYGLLGHTVDDVRVGQHKSVVGHGPHVPSRARAGNRRQPARRRHFALICAKRRT